MRTRLKQLNGWHKFWLMFAGVFLASTIAVIVAAWPKADPAVVADVRSAECGAWLAYAEGQFPDIIPQASAPCRALRLFVLDSGVQVRSEADYRSYLTRQGILTTLEFLAVWAGFMVAVYAVGWSTSRITGKFLEMRSRRING